MSNTFFQFREFTVHQEHCAMKVTTDGCLFGAWVADDLQSQENLTGKLLDIGTGTGLLSLMIAQKTKKEIIGIEIDMAAAGQAKENAKRSPWEQRLHIIHMDIEDFYPAYPHQFKSIISNPPFYENELVSPSQQKNTAHHSIHLRITGLLKIIQSLLEPGGQFYLLLPYKRFEEAKGLVIKNKMSLSQVMLVRQSPDHDYFRVFIKGINTPTPGQPVIKEEMSIRDRDKNYTAAFTRLLKDYYLSC
ncbi:MAG: methyltransferase [Terrimonas sp.]|nr:methyltransferase [Terrimonas sp.]